MEGQPEQPVRHATPFVYSVIYNNEHNLIIAGGAGDNELRVFDSQTHELLCAYNNLPKAVTCVTKANNTSDFAFGSVDSKVRCIQLRTNFI